MWFWFVDGKRWCWLIFSAFLPMWVLFPCGSLWFEVLSGCVFAAPADKCMGCGGFKVPVCLAAECHVFMYHTPCCSLVSPSLTWSWSTHCPPSSSSLSGPTLPPAAQWICAWLCFFLIWCLFRFVCCNLSISRLFTRPVLVCCSNSPRQSRQHGKKNPYTSHFITVTVRIKWQTPLC